VERAFAWACTSRRSIVGLAAALCLLASVPVRAAGDEPILRVAVAANFRQAAGQLCDAFFAGRPGRCVLTPGASGLLFAKVMQGAPFDVFLSADVSRAQALEANGHAVPGSRFTYAVGRLVLWRPGLDGVIDLGKALADPTLRTLAIANPGTAPYGAAALETLQRLGIESQARYRIVQGESVAQAFQFVASGAADAGFVALSQMIEYQRSSVRSLDSGMIVVDPSLHRPIDQQAVLLTRASSMTEARAFLEFLRGPAARRIIEAAGYMSPQA
jgi:molybdate transport system substrate-binding protein